MATNPMKSRNTWRDRLRAPFKVVGEHIGVELPGGRAIFTSRRGGVSAEPFDTLNVGLTTNDYVPAVQENRKRIAEFVGIPGDHWLESKQVHGAEVQRISEPPESGNELAEADGAATSLEGFAPMVVSADCLPAALITPGAVAMIHAGWRGLCADILKEGVQAIRDLGAEGEIQVAIGPGIGVCCYEVSTRVHRAFMRYPRGVARLSNHAHLKNVARLQLQSAGVSLEHVHDCDICTMCAPRSLFHSHRRDFGDDPANTGRQASLVWRVGEDGGGDWPTWSAA